MPRNYVYRSYKSWTNRQPGDTPQGRPSILFIHISEGAAGRINSEREAIEVIRGIDRYHRSLGWSGAGYGFFLAQAKRPWRKPRIFEARGLRRVPSSQQGANAGNTSICVLGTTRDLIRGSTKKALKEFYRSTGCRAIKGHREQSATECPGDQLMRVVRDLRR